MAVSHTADLHTSVLLEEAIAILNVKDRKLVVDATLGSGGHTEALLKSSPELRVVGIDQDKHALGQAKVRLAAFEQRVSLAYANFSQIKEVLDDLQIESVDGILVDLGVSSMQFDSELRGFSFRFDSPLDMRMDPDGGKATAAEMLEELDQDEIANLIFEYGEERFSRRIARKIVERREAGNPVASTRDLAELVERCIPKKQKERIHPATKTFQALRIAVNDELGSLQRLLDVSIGLLAPHGRLAIISFHSIEDRMVKKSFRKRSGICECPPRIPQCVCGATKEVRILTKRPIIPSEDELRVNPRSRSAKLRAVEKLPG